MCAWCMASSLGGYSNGGAELVLTSGWQLLCCGCRMLRAKCRVVPANYMGSYVLTQVLPLRWEQELATAAGEQDVAFFLASTNGSRAS